MQVYLFAYGLEEALLLGFGPQGNILSQDPFDPTAAKSISSLAPLIAQEYLLPLAEKNRDANRLLVLIRNNVLRKLNRQRELDNIYRPRADTPQ